MCERREGMRGWREWEEEGGSKMLRRLSETERECVPERRALTLPNAPWPTILRSSKSLRPTLVIPAICTGWFCEISFSSFASAFSATSTATSGGSVGCEPQHASAAVGESRVPFSGEAGVVAEESEAPSGLSPSGCMHASGCGRIGVALSPCMQGPCTEVSWQGRRPRVAATGGNFGACSS